MVAFARCWIFNPCNPPESTKSTPEQFQPSLSAISGSVELYILIKRAPLRQVPLAQIVGHNLIQLD